MFRIEKLLEGEEAEEGIVACVVEVAGNVYVQGAEEVLKGESGAWYAGFVRFGVLHDPA